MSYTLQQVLDMACVRAGRTRDQHVAESLLPDVLKALTRRVVHDEGRRHLLMALTEVTLADGSAALPAAAFVEGFCYASLRDPAAPGKEYAFIADWDSFASQSADPLSGAWAVTGRTLYAVEPNAVYADGAGESGARRLRHPVSVRKPAAAGTAFTEDDEVIDELVAMLAEALTPKVVKKS